jgi:hypothetical protein
MARGPAALGGAGRKGIGRGESLGTTQGRAQDPSSADLRELDRRHARLIRNLRRVYGYGFIATGGLAIELAVRVGGLSVPRGALKKTANGLDHACCEFAGTEGKPMSSPGMITTSR